MRSARSSAAAARALVSRAMSRSASSRRSASEAAGPNIHSGSRSGVSTVSRVPVAARLRSSTAVMIASS